MKNRSLTDEEQVTHHIQRLESSLAEIVETIRRIVLNTAPEIGERIKWNNPSFYYTGDMPPFDPKEYRRDILVMNLHKGRVMLVFPSGAKVSNTDGLLEGHYPDGHRTVVFSDLNDVNAKADALRNVIREWLELVEK